MRQDTSAEAIGDIAKELKLPEDSWRRRRLAEKVSEMSDDLPLFQSRSAFTERARTRDTLVRIEMACRKRPYRPARAMCLLERHPEASDLLLFQVADALNPKRTQAPVKDGRASRRLKHLLANDPDALLPYLRKALDCLERSIEHGRGGRRHREDEAFKDVVALLGTLYWEITGQVPASALSAEGAGGPFVRFLLAVLPQIDGRWRFKTADALRIEVLRLKTSGIWKALSEENSPAFRFVD